MEKGITLEEILNAGLTREPSPFQFLRNLNEVRAISVYMSGILKILKGLKKACVTMRKTYVHQIHDHKTDLALLVALKQIQTCYNFYYGEYLTALNMSDEFINYMLDGHLLGTLLGDERPEEDLKDSRR